MVIIDLEALMEDAQDMLEERAALEYDPPILEFDFDEPELDPDFVVLSQIREYQEDVFDDRVPF